MAQMAAGVEQVVGREHWATKEHASGPVRLFLWEKYLPPWEGRFAGTALLMHGSSMASTPTFDLRMPGRGEEYSVMAYFARITCDATPARATLAPPNRLTARARRR